MVCKVQRQVPRKSRYHFGSGVNLARCAIGPVSEAHLGAFCLSRPLNRPPSRTSQYCTTAAVLVSRRCHSSSSLIAVLDSYISISKNAALHQISLGSNAVSSGATFFACFSPSSPVARAGEVGRVTGSRIARRSCLDCAGHLPIRDDL